MLEGEGDREVFGINKLQTVYAVSVMKIDRSNELLLLNAGQSHGIRKGTRFAIYPLAITDFGQVDKRLAIVEIDKRGATDSWAKIIADFRRGNIEQGAQAVLINPVDVRLKRKVYLVYENNEINDNKELSPSLTTTRNLTMTQQQALDKIRDTIMEKNKNNESLLELALADIDDQADFQIAINKQGEYEIWDPAGNAIPNLNPPLMINDSGSISKIIQRLEHLTKYSNIQLIDNLDAASELSRKLVVELFEVPDDYERGDRLSDLQPIAAEGNTKIAEVGQKLILRIRNTSKKVLNVTILDLQPDWGVSQIYPSGTGAYFIPIDPGHEELFPLQVDLPSDYKEGKDVIKVFATLDHTNFRWLELPVLDQPVIRREITRGGGAGEPTNTLEQLMAAITKDRPVTRHINSSATPSNEWTTANMEIKIYRP